MTALSITPLPDPPSRASPDDFADKADAFLAALPGHATELESLRVLLSPLADAAAAILASANYKGLYSSLSGALAIPASVYHLGRFWLLTESVANVAAEVPGTSAKWVTLDTRGPAFSAYIATSHNCATGANTTLQFNTEDYDTDGCFNTSTYRFTPNQAGYYHVTGHVSALAGANGSAAALVLLKNGAAFKNGNQMPVLVGGGSNSYGLRLNMDVYMNGSTDYLELALFQNTGSNMTALGGSAPNVVSAFQAHLARRP